MTIPAEKKPAPTRRTNEARSEATRNALVEAVIGSLFDAGYARTTMTAIGRRAGITTGAMQHHFGSKDELIFAALDKLFNEIFEQLEEISPVADSLPLAEECARVVEALWTTYYGHERYVAVVEIIVGSRSDKDLHERVILHRQASLKTLEAGWFRIFDLKGEGASDTLQFALSVLRGSALSGYSEPSGDAVPRHIQLLGEALARQIQSLKSA